MDKKSGGFTLVEIIVVIAILGIITAIAVPRLIGFTSMAKESVCITNRKTVERMYTTFLFENDIDHSDSIFNQFLIDNFDEVCPAGGVISYEDGKVKCSVHSKEEQPPEEAPPEEEGPWLWNKYVVTITKNEKCIYSEEQVFKYNILHIVILSA